MSSTQFMPGGTIHLHRHDLPEGLTLGPVVAVDTETMGLNPHRDRLCLVQLSAGDGHAHLVQLIPPALGGHGYDCPNLSRLLADPATVKLMHFARFDVAIAAAQPRHHRRAGALHQDRRPARSAPSPTATASRTSARNCSASICPSSSRPPTGARWN